MEARHPNFSIGEGVIHPLKQEFFFFLKGKFSKQKPKKSYEEFFSTVKYWIYIQIYSDSKGEKETEHDCTNKILLLGHYSIEISNLSPIHFGSSFGPVSCPLLLLYAGRKAATTSQYFTALTHSKSPWTYEFSNPFPQGYNQTPSKIL